MNKNVLNKLSKIESKVELAEVKVDLALIQDLEKEYTKIFQATQQIKSEATRLSKELFAFRDVYNVDASKLINLISEYKKAAASLGVDVDGKFDKAFNDLSDVKNTYRYLIG